MFVFPGGQQSNEYEIANSLMLDSSLNQYLYLPAGAASGTQIQTFNFKFKLGVVDTNNRILAYGYYDSNNYQYISISNNQIIIAAVFAGTAYILTTAALLRDPSGWYDLTVGFDTTQATASDRQTIELNGKIQTVTGNYCPQNSGLNLGARQANNWIGQSVTGTTANAFDGYLANVTLVKGVKLSASSFGYFDAANHTWWRPKAYTGTYGAGGYLLEFKDSAALGTDTSGNGNNWTLNNITSANQCADTPTNNFCVWSQVDRGTDNSAGAPIKGNLVSYLVVPSGQLAKGNQLSTFAMSTGKWYAEFIVTDFGGWALALGIQKASYPITSASILSGSSGDCYAYYNSNGNKYNGSTGSAYGASYTTNDVIGIAVNLDAGGISFYKNGVSQGVAFTGITGDYKFFIAPNSTGVTYIISANFGQRPFAYSPPAGFKSLCTKNLPTPTGAAAKPWEHFGVRTWNGTTSFPYSPVTNLEFQPDFVWAKARSNDYDSVLYDSVRGTGTGASLCSNNTSSEGTNSLCANLSAFNSNGFTVQETSNTNILAQTGQSFVGWLFRAGGSAVTNTAGSITSQVSANTAAGFSIVSYTGTGANATVGHGLGVAPDMIIIKSRSGARNWVVSHKSLTNISYYLLLNSSAAQANTCSEITAKSSTNITLSNDNYVNGSGETYIAYCFAEIPGYSKIGSYTGNGSADNQFVHCGFTPAFVLTKRTDSTGDWFIWDGSRVGYNPSNEYLLANSANAEGTVDYIDIVSNGFKVRNSGITGTWIFLAIAESPFKYSNAR